LSKLCATERVELTGLEKKMFQSEERPDNYHERLEELSRLTGELAHEIKNPLSTIKVNLKLISEELEQFKAAVSGKNSVTTDNQQFARLLRKMTVIQKEADRLEQILNGFLRYVGKTELQLVTVDINELVSDMIDFYTPQAYAHSITVRQGLHNKALLCNVDAGMLKQVILNLFINAQQAMPGGGELMIKTAGEKQNAVIQISETGTGIDAEKLPRIFEPYHSFKLDGSGLGLATAKKIIDAHKGTISVDSALGKGTQFTIKLPLQVEN
jgi:signal transduction histidine kinase